MKNIFKMMLVAVAAMGVISCSTEQEGFVVDSVGVTTEIELCMSLDDTRSKFDGLNDAGTAYTSVFSGDEKFHFSMSSADKQRSHSGYIEPNADMTGSLIRPTITINGAASDYAGGRFLICSPTTSGITLFDSFNLNVPTKQVPLADSCDPAAHILYGECTLDGTTNIPVAMKHFAAYGCMTLNGMDERLAEDERLGAVIITINSHNYTLDPINVQNNVYWFACTPEKPQTMVVTLTTLTTGDEEGRTYIKTFDLSKNAGAFTFTQGEVSKFKANMMSDDVVVSEAPVVVADYLLTDIYYTTRYNGGFYIYNDNNEYVVVRFNAEDFDPGTEYETDGYYRDYYTHNSIKVGEYTWCDDGTPNVGEFRIQRWMFDGNEYTTFGEFVNTETAKLTVELDENGRYVIKLFFQLGYNDEYNVTYDIGYSEVNDEQLDPIKTALATPAPTYELNGTTATISWPAVDGAMSYYVWCSNGDVEQAYGDTSITLDNLTEGASYKVAIKALPAEGSFLYKESLEGVVEFTVPYGEAEQLATPTITATEATDSTIKVTWSAVANASGYQVTCGDLSADVTDTEYTFEGLDAETEYTISVVAKGDGLQYTDSDVASTTVTTEAASQGGDGGVVDVTGWKTTQTMVSINGVNKYQIDITNGSTTISFMTDQNSGSKTLILNDSEVDDMNDYYDAWSVRVNGVDVENPTGEVNLTVATVMIFMKSYTYELVNVVLDGVTYNGVTAQAEVMQ